MRPLLIVGNWKLNGNTLMVNQIICSLCKMFSKFDHCNVVIAPPVMYLDQTRKILTDYFHHIYLGAQNVDINLLGAFTGDISAKMLKDVGVKYVIVGHSERRTYHKESDEVIAKKFSILKQEGLIPILCIGETKEEKELGQTEEVCIRQINAVIKNLGILAIKDSVIAYEPVWAIGSGNPANPIKVQLIHKFIRNYISQYNKKIASEIIIQYGGSVNEQNALSLFLQPDIDGALIGGASLNANSFYKIVHTASITKKI